MRVEGVGTCEFGYCRRVKVKLREGYFRLVCGVAWWRGNIRALDLYNWEWLTNWGSLKIPIEWLECSTLDDLISIFFFFNVFGFDMCVMGYGPVEKEKHGILQTEITLTDAHDCERAAPCSTQNTSSFTNSYHFRGLFIYWKSLRSQKFT